MNSSIFRRELEAKSDTEWFDAICEILKKENKPTVQIIEQLIGKEDNKCQLMTGKGLIPFDTRFDYASVLPSVPLHTEEKPLEYLMVTGSRFFLNMCELIKRFPNYTQLYVPYDNSIVATFTPVGNLYQFRSISCITEHSFIDTTTHFHNLSFDFQD